VPTGTLPPPLSTSIIGWTLKQMKKVPWDN
jgi:hypothetical protein